MSTNTNRNVPHAITRLKEVWRELDYAQRRSLELRTGLSFDKPVSDPPIRRAEVEQLEALYNLPAAHEDVAAWTAAPPANAH